jgi:1-acyl-sn-glycerol-3-phosphate acyltransferase
MPEPDWPSLRRDRHSALVAAGAACLALPTVALLVLDHGSGAPRWERAWWLAGAAAAGALLPFLYWAPFRALGLVPFAAIGWLATAAHGVYWNEWPGWAHGLPAGLIVGALARGRRGPAPAWETAALFGAVLAGVGVAWVFLTRGRPFDVAGWFVLGVTAVLAVWSWVRLLRPVIEMLSEPVLWVMFRLRQTGPGLENFPMTGPCIVIANHACWIDPFFLAKVLPRPTTPVMTSRFYDLPLIRRFMIVFCAIRVPEKTYKKEAPELEEVVAALDRGECVVLFPEGYLRRSPDRPLRRFGQGIWQILKARPDTPVFATWIEGGWGSYTSFFNGPPTKNKKRDFRRPLGVGVSAAVTVPPELLEDHLRTRIHLMNLVSEARRHLGLEPLPPFALPQKGEAEEDGEGE